MKNKHGVDVTALYESLMRSALELYSRGDEYKESDFKMEYLEQYTALSMQEVGREHKYTSDMALGMLTNHLDEFDEESFIASFSSEIMAHFDLKLDKKESNPRERAFAVGDESDDMFSSYAKMTLALPIRTQDSDEIGKWIDEEEDGTPKHHNTPVTVPKAESKANATECILGDTGISFKS